MIQLSELKKHLLKSKKKPLLGRSGAKKRRGGGEEFIDDSDGIIEGELEAERRKYEIIDKEEFGDEESKELEEEIGE
ncbi:hypothetical protein [Borreliella garinii]|uniref:hypothetical protein n=1 Tax=Borreliella garinii TaxID=29519 RepID=UPI0003F4C8B3|nr:hypothetical protein [Borreliella garinii]